MHGIEGVDLYHMTCQASQLILTHLVPRFPERDGDVLVAQLSRASQTLPRLITEESFEEAMAEAYEIVVSLCCCHYWYTTQADTTLCRHLIETYSQVSRRLLMLSETQLTKRR